MRNNHRTPSTRSQTTIQNHPYDESSGSQSDDTDEERITEDFQIHHRNRQKEILFSEES